MDRYSIPDDWDVVQAMTNGMHRAPRKLRVTFQLNAEPVSRITFEVNSELTKPEDVERVVAARTHEVWS